MLPFAYFGIHSGGLRIAVDLVLLVATVLYLCLIYWTVADARRRIADPLLIGCAFVVALIPFIGPLVYLILRPPEFLVDVQQRELEIQAAEARLHELDYGLCPHCNYPVERDFLRCPSCLRRLKERCVGCSTTPRPGLDDLPLLRDGSPRRDPAAPQAAARPRGALSATPVECERRRAGDRR